MRVRTKEQPGAVPFLEAQDVPRVLRQLPGVDVEELVARISLHHGQEFLAAV